MSIRYYYFNVTDLKFCVEPKRLISQKNVFLLPKLGFSTSYGTIFDETFNSSV